MFVEYFYFEPFVFQTIPLKPLYFREFNYEDYDVILKFYKFEDYVFMSSFLDDFFDSIVDIVFTEFFENNIENFLNSCVDSYNNKELLREFFLHSDLQELPKFLELIDEEYGSLEIFYRRFLDSFSDSSFFFFFH